MDKSNFEKLLKKHLEGTASKEESDFLISYYDLFESGPDILSEITEDEIIELKNEIKTDIWERIRVSADTDASKQRPVSVFLNKRIALAAALVLMICTVGIFYNRPLKQNSVNTNAEGVQYQEHRLLRLPDGSTVIISAGSKLDYPSTFEGLAKREVYLEGQAYFDIKHNPEKPFIIHTGKLKTTVLGTAFDIKAWPDDEVVVTVTRGKVKVSDQEKNFGTIIPDQQITYKNGEAEIVKKKVSTNEYLSWKEQDLLLDNVTVGEAAELLEERFKVIILIKDEQIRTNRFTTTFQKGETLEDVLKSICEFNGAVYQYDKDKSAVLISLK